MNVIKLISVMAPEVLLSAMLVLLLLMKIFSDNLKRSTVLFIISFFFLGATVFTLILHPAGSAFGGMFVVTPLIGIEKAILLLATFIISLLAFEWLSRYDNYLEFYLLLISILLGMFIMVSAGHFLSFYLGLEMATIPLAALSAFDLEKPRSGEAGMKLILSSAFSSGVLLMGISFIYGTCGSLYFDEVKTLFSGSTLQVAGFAFLVAGFAFKISVVPFHLWTADVYEGSPVAVTAFLSVVSKGAAVFIFMSALYNVFGAISATWVYLLAILAVATMIIGNLFAIRQQNIKRFLAFSSITQAGYILIGITSGTIQGTASVVYFILVYLFSNLAAFTVVAIISEKTGKENISDYNGLYQTNPRLSLVMMLALFSLAGIPPTAGFFGKWFLLASGMNTGLMTLIIIAAVNLVISLYYYLRVVQAMFVVKNEMPVPAIQSNNAARLGLIICSAAIILTGFFSFVYQYIYSFSSGIQ
ncbi:MAG: NADH-quinone oxidoreductase subunit N [Bacteroidota bacterium]